MRDVVFARPTTPDVLAEHIVSTLHGTLHGTMHWNDSLSFYLLRYGFEGPRNLSGSATGVVSGAQQSPSPTSKP